MRQLFNLATRSKVPFDYQITYSRRKTLCIQVKQGQVRVLAPRGYSKALIINFVQQKQNWIRDKLSQQSQLQEDADAYKQSGQLLTRGTSKKLVCERATHYQLSQDERQVFMCIPYRVGEANLASYKRQKLALWYREQAETYLPQRIAQLNQQTQLRHNKLTIKQYKARWGSCNNKGEICLNYLLMMTPDFVIDYVIIHELCHLEHLNHSARFWQLVHSHCPEFKTAKLWLKQHQNQLRTFHA